MKDYSLYQIVQPKVELTDEEWEELFQDHPSQILTTRQYWKLKLGGFMHRFGSHFWVVWKVYDPHASRIVDMGRVCAFCPAGRQDR